MNQEVIDANTSIKVGVGDVCNNTGIRERIPNGSFTAKTTSVAKDNVDGRLTRTSQTWRILHEGGTQDGTVFPRLTSPYSHIAISAIKVKVRNQIL